jgi:hypothetical protein
MMGASFSRVLLVLVPFVALPASWLLGGNDERSVIPLKHAHAHNDYQHKRPLLDALDCGFCSVEADVWLVGGQLLVGHWPWDLTQERTLEKLYLEPLRDRIKAQGGKVYPEGPTVFLLIDVKSEARATYAAVSKVLAKYEDILSVARGDKFEVKAVTVVISGNCDRDAITRQEVRYAAIDGRLADLDSDAAAHLMPWISAAWPFAWQGEGPMPEEERTRLRALVRKAHERGRQVRFWGTPEKVSVWKELRASEVDLINTDRLRDLQQFLVPEGAFPPGPGTAGGHGVDRY